MIFTAIGRTEILYNTINLLRTNGHQAKLIITSKEAPEYTRTSEDFRHLAKEINAEFLYTPKINDPENIERIKSLGHIDICISVNCVSIINQEVINLFPLGILNAHSGNLPKYRGNAPVAWAIINGDDVIGHCIHNMIGGELDSGNIIIRNLYQTNINTKIKEVYNWISTITPGMFLEAFNVFEKNKDYYLEQQPIDKSNVLRTYPRIPEDGKIDWNKSNMEILRLINASSEPYSGAFCEYNNDNLIIWSAGIEDDEERCCGVPGQVTAIDKSDNSILVLTGDGKLRIKEVSLNNQRIRPAEVIKSLRNRLK